MSTSELILAIDQGTTGTTCLIVDEALAVLGRATVEFAQHFPQPGWVEHDADELWASVNTAIGNALDNAAVDAGRIAAVGLTNQRETSLIWDRKTGAAIHRALVWQDRRTAAACAALKAAGHEPEVQQATGLLLDPYFSATKLRWTLDHVQGATARAEAGELAAGTIDTFLVWRLTGGQSHVTDPSNACRTSLWPLAGGGWSEALCELFGVPARILPRVVPCTAAMGTTRGVARLPDGIPIHGMAGDQQAALFGQACFDAGQAKCTYGTGAFVMLNTGGEVVRSRHGLLTSVAWQIGEETTYCLEGSCFVAGAVVQWLRDQLGIIEHAHEIEALARQVPDSDGVVLVPAHAGLGAPHWRPEARGIMVGLTRGTSKAHLARAALEGIALQVGDLLDAMAKDLGEPLDVLRVDGGAAANDLLMQIQADVLGVVLQRPTVLEATALGAVALAGLGVGMWSDTDTLARVWQQDARFEPAGDAEQLAGLRRRWSAAVERA